MKVVKLEMFLLRKAGAMDSVSFSIMQPGGHTSCRTHLNSQWTHAHAGGEEEGHTVSNTMVNHQED